MHKNNHPLAIYCTSCGAPAVYDIVKQDYHCKYCGARTDIREPVQKLGQWRDAHRKSFFAEENSAEGLHVCSNCGAEVMIPAGEATGNCEFCGGKFVRREFAQSDELPEVIIPFVLTEEEARERLQEWANANQKEKEARTVLSAIDKLRGYYLPYELIRGPVTAEVERMETFSDRKYHCGGFLNGIAVNTSKQLDNLVLDAMEPFEWTASRPFEFSFLAGQRVKLSDIGAKALEKRVLEEVEAGFRPEAEKELQTTGIIMRMQAGNILRLPALLPVYVLSLGPVLAVVNGQTGRVAVSREKEEKVLSWLIEPTLLTLLVGGLLALWEPYVGLMSMVVFGLIFFTAFSDGRGEEWRRVIFKTKKSRAERVQSKLTVTEGENTVEDTTTQAVFTEPVNGETVPVKIAFYPPGRIFKTLLLLLVFNFLPAILAFPLDIEGTADYSYLAVWLVLSVPASLIFWVAVGRIRVYNHPILHRVFPDGKLERVKSDQDRNVSFFTRLKEFKELAACGPILFILGVSFFMLVGTIAAILIPE